MSQVSKLRALDCVGLGLCIGSI